MPDLGQGAVFAGHRIEGVAGRGGMGTVYRATHIALDHMVALKVIAPDLADDGSFRERFRLESRIAVSLRHPNVVPIHDAGEEDGLLFVTMDLIDGPDLRKLLTSRGPLEPLPAVAILEQVAAALDVAHSRGLVHRDIKPGNILIEDRGGSDHAYLTDFGLTKRIGQPSAASGLTTTGAFVGTLDYVAPEQIRGEHLDARTDVYALGCVLYEILVSRPPFGGREEKVAKMYAHLQDQPEPLEGRAAPLADIVERAMAKERDERFPSAGDMARAARAALEGGAVAEAERSVATGPAAPTEAYETPVAQMPGVSELDPAVASQVPGDPTVESQPPIDPTVESESPADVGPPTAAGARALATEVEPAPGSAARSRRSPPPKLIGGGLAAAVLVVVAIVVLGSGGGGDGGSPEDTAIGTIGDRITVSDFPVGVAAGDGEVRVATRDAGQLVRVEAGTDDGTPVPLDTVNTAEDVVFADGFWWATSPDDEAVVRVGSDGTSQQIDIPGGPTGIAAQGNNSVWVTNSDSNQLTRIETGGPAAQTVPLGPARRPHGIAFGGGDLWITSRDNDKLIRVSTADLSKPEIAADVGPNPKGVAVAGGVVWVANAGRKEDGSDGSVMRFDPGSGQPEKVAGLSGTMRDVVEAPDGTIWASNGQGSVAAIDAGSMELIGELPLQNSAPEDLAFGQGLIWVTGGDKDVVTSIEPGDSSG